MWGPFRSRRAGGPNSSQSCGFELAAKRISPQRWRRRGASCGASRARTRLTFLEFRRPQIFWPRARYAASLHRSRWNLLC